MTPIHASFKMVLSGEGLHPLRRCELCVVPYCGGVAAERELSQHRRDLDTLGRAYSMNFVPLAVRRWPERQQWAGEQQPRALDTSYATEAVERTTTSMGLVATCASPANRVSSRASQPQGSQGCLHSAAGSASESDRTSQQLFAAIQPLRYKGAG
jgi:hypothetical protein